MAKITEKQSRQTVDETSKGIIYDGATMSQMCELLHMDFRTLSRRMRMSDVKPCGKRNGYDIYAVHEVAPWVLPPKMDIEKFIRNMNPQDLPKMLSKEYWAGMRSRQEYMLREGDLWPTEKVQAAFSKIVQILVMNTRVIEDEVDRKEELSERQRALVKSSIDSLIATSREELMRHFTASKNAQHETDDDDDL